MAISDYSTTRDSNASIAPGDLRSNDYRRDQQIINAIRQLMADLAGFVGGTVAQTIRLQDTGDVSLVSTTHALQIGADAAANLRMDSNEIQSVNNGTVNDLHIQADSGRLVLHQNNASGANSILDLKGGRIEFPATQQASSNANTLDDYEEGSWTPEFKGSGTAGTFTYSHQEGKYIKVGKFVNWSCAVRASAITVAPTGNLAIIGLPFVFAGTPQDSGHLGYMDIAQAGITSWGILMDANFPLAATNQLRISGMAAGAGLNTQLLSASLAAGNFVIASGVYRATN